MHLLHEPVSATVARTSSPAPATNLPPLETIDARKVLRVGYLPDALPFAFFNQQRRPGRLRRRARASPGARDGRHPRLRARGSRPAGGAARGGVLRPRDVGRGRDDESGAGGAVLGFVSGRNPRVRRAGRPARTVRELGRHSRSRRADDRRSRCAVLRPQAPRAAAACRHPGARRRHRAAVRPRRHARRRAGAARRARVGLDA